MKFATAKPKTPPAPAVPGSPATTTEVIWGELRKNRESETQWNKLYARKFGLMKQIARRVGVPSMEWSNLVQDGMVKLYNKLGKPPSGDTNPRKLINVVAAGRAPLSD